MDNETIRLLAIGAPGLLIGIVFHEAAHAWMAKKFGDPTAELSGRLSLNPAVHLDIFGTVIFPLICIFLFKSPPFGWAKPVPVNSRNFKDVKKGIFWVAFAGPLMNIIIGVVAALLYAIVYTKTSMGFSYREPVLQITSYALQINFILAAFNLIPFPPLDGSKMVSTFLSYENAIKFDNLQRYAFIFILVIWTTNILSYLFTPVLFFAHFLVNGFSSLLS